MIFIGYGKDMITAGFWVQIRYLRDITGSIMPLTALLLPIILGMAGLGFDISAWVMHKRDLQSAADAAALAAAWEMANNNDEVYADFAALKEAENNGFNPDLDGSSIDTEYEEDEDGQSKVTVSLLEEDTEYFSSMIFRGTVKTSAISAAIVLPPIGDFCMLALDRTADDAISAVGNVTVNANGCGIASNSNSDSSINLAGSVVMNVGDLTLAGDLDIGSNVDLTYETLSTHARRFPDPYAGLETPEYTACTNAQINAGPTRINNAANSHITNAAGTRVFCGGLTVTGNFDVTFDPGVYVMDCGDFNVTGGGSMIGEGVSFVLTCSLDGGTYGNLSIAGGKEIFFSAPLEGEDMEGVVFYQDRDAPASSQCNSLLGTAAIELEGVAYFPSRCFDIGGNDDATSSQTSPCTRIIAKTINLHGNPSIGNNCEGTAADDIGRIAVKLVL